MDSEQGAISIVMIIEAYDQSYDVTRNGMNWSACWFLVRRSTLCFGAPVVHRRDNSGYQSTFLAIYGDLETRAGLTTADVFHRQLRMEMMHPEIHSTNK